MASAQNELAKTFKSLHKPGSPIVLANVYDGPTAKAVASLPAAKAVATASYAVAEAAGMADNDLTLAANLAAARVVALTVAPFAKPVTVDFQDGYGDQLEDGIANLVKLGVVGVNLEDCDKGSLKLYSKSEAVARIRKVLEVASKHGVPDFVVNARCDVLLRGGQIAEAIERGKEYLDAGATTVFVFGGPTRGGVSREEVKQLVDAFGGRLNVSMKLSPDGLKAKELASIGVARISIGPGLQVKLMAQYKEEAQKILEV